jgi:SP family galactose:H+ symporter-like MFS transporter|tara:strand:+ start:7521 stop:9212 length:1692 start_codon:yes stop_codon:yes gene_type:complete
VIYFVALVAGLAGILFGFDEGVIAGALSSLRAEFQITSLEEGMMTAAVPFGALFGALLAGSLAERFGRRQTLLFASVLFVIGALCAGLAPGVWVLTGCRLVLGLAVGVAAMVAPLYISESAPSKQRGMLVSVYQLAITIGILSAYLVNFAFDDKWRTMFMLGALPGIALFLGMAVLKDTPRWYILKGRTEDARRALQRVRGTSVSQHEIESELGHIKAAMDTGGSGRWADLLAPVVRPAFIVGIGLFFLQQLSGINAVIYYAPTVFQEAGFDSGSTQLMATIGVGVVNVLMTLVGMYLIDRIGRRRLLFLGFVGTALGLGMIAVGAATGIQSLDILAVIGMALYIAAFAASIGPLPWVMMAEIFPSHVRGMAMGVTSLTNWGFNFLVVFSFPVLVSALGLGGVFGIYALVCVAGVIFTYLRIPETSGVSLEDIEKHLLSGRPFHMLGQFAPPSMHTDAPDITQDQAHEMLTQLVELSPYRAYLRPLINRISEVGYDNHQVRTALRIVHARVSRQPGQTLTQHDMGSERETFVAFFEHIRFASPSFLEWVGESQAEHKGDSRGA